MNKADILVGIDKDTAASTCEQLQNNLSRLNGVVTVEFEHIKPHCQGLHIFFDTEKTSTCYIRRALKTFDDTMEWNSCYPGEHCKTCQLQLIN